MVRGKPDISTAKTPDSRMPSVRIKVEVKEALWDLAEKGESYSEVIARIIDYYKSNHK
jgi:predicted CopG family antitoxin